MWDGSIFCPGHRGAIQELMSEYKLKHPTKLSLPEDITEDQYHGLIEHGPCSVCRYGWSIRGTKDGVHFLHETNLRASDSRTPDQSQVHTSHESEPLDCGKESCTELR